MKKFLTTLLSLSISLSPIADAKHVKIYLLTGQSNSLGTTADKSEKDPANPPANDLDKKIPFFWSNRSTTASDGPAAIIGDSDGKITTLQKQQGQGENPAFWGPEIAFGRAFHTAGKRDFMIIKASRGGGGNGYWLKDAQMYQHVIDTVKTATDELDKLDHTYEFACLLYLQGESNNPAEAKVAGQRFSDLLDQLREALPNAKTMPAVIGGIAAAGPKNDLTRQQQKELAEQRDDIEYFSNLDLQKQLYDRLHFDKKAKLEIGQRFAKAVQTLEKPRCGQWFYIFAPYTEGNLPQFSGHYLIDSKGNLSVPVIGRVLKANTMTLEQLETALNKLYRSKANHPEHHTHSKVGLQFTSKFNDSSNLIESEKALIVGNVNSPGAVSVGSSLAISHALELAGGATSFGAINRVEIYSDSTKRILDLKKVDQQNFQVKPGDRVYVPQKKAYGR